MSVANRLTQDELDRFSRDGFVFPIKVLEPQEASDCLARLEAMEARRAGRLSPVFNAKPHLLVPWLWDLVHDPRIVERIEALLGPDILCFGTSFISKSPGGSRYVAWHQDITYWGLSTTDAVTAWLALTPSVPENGCVRAVPGTHRHSLAHTDSGDSANLLGRGEKMVAQVEASDAIDLALAPGEMSLHHCLAVHGSARNNSRLRRVGFAIRYMSGATMPRDGKRNSATLVRGRNLGSFALEKEPEGEFHPAAVARHIGIVRDGMRIIFDGAPSAIKTESRASD
ncbi:MAG: phytanoyl-CoA dioxygenase family protein [Methylocystis sp.]|uniref:phytanoyl-CoA dioxygenase family protein n=1 Tax=Methylocystis sp. TaxID=1911079 RepID=UPI0039550F88